MSNKLNGFVPLIPWRPDMARVPVERNRMLLLLLAEDSHQVVDASGEGKAIAIAASRLGKKPRATYIVLLSMEKAGLIWVKRRPRKTDAFGLTPDGLRLARVVSSQPKQPAKSNLDIDSPLSELDRVKKLSRGVVLPSKPMPRLNSERKSGYRKESKEVVSWLGSEGYVYSRRGGVERLLANHLDVSTDHALNLIRQMVSGGTLVKEAWSNTIYGLALPQRHHLLHDKIMSEDQIPPQKQQGTKGSIAA